MSKRPNIKTTIEEAVDYWSSREDECGLSIDWAEAKERCWRCGCKRNLQRCHIIPDSLGGKDEPSNIVLLCKRCHAEGPNVTSPEIMWDWIRAYGVPFYDTFWDVIARKEYKFIYNKSLVEDIKDILEQAGLSEKDPQFAELLKKSIDLAEEQASWHYGQPYFNTATMVGIYRMAVKNLADMLKVDFSIKKQESDKIHTPWWMQI